MQIKNSLILIIKLLIKNQIIKIIKEKIFFLRINLNNKNIYSYNKNNNYRYYNNFNIQLDVKKGQINSLNENKKKFNRGYIKYKLLFY